MNKSADCVRYCPHGHEMTPDNTVTFLSTRGRPTTACRTCRNEQATARRIASRTSSRPYRSRLDPPTHCPHGHEWNEENTGWTRRKNGIHERYCRACQKRYRGPKPASVLQRFFPKIH